MGEENCLLRSQHLTPDNTLTAVLVDAPSYRRSTHCEGGCTRNTSPLTNTVTLLNKEDDIPVEFVRTNLGSQADAFIAAQLIGHDRGVKQSILITGWDAHEVPKEPPYHGDVHSYAEDGLHDGRAPHGGEKQHKGKPRL